MLSYCSLGSCRLSRSPAGRLQSAKVVTEAAVASGERLTEGQAFAVAGGRQALLQAPAQRGCLPTTIIDAAPTPALATAPGGARR